MFAIFVIDPSGKSKLHELEAGSLVKAKREALQHLQPGYLLELWRFQHRKNWLVYVTKGKEKPASRRRTPKAPDSGSTPTALPPAPESSRRNQLS